MFYLQKLEAVFVVVVLFCFFNLNDFLAGHWKSTEDLEQPLIT